MGALSKDTQNISSKKKPIYYISIQSLFKCMLMNIITKNIGLKENCKVMNIISL